MIAVVAAGCPLTASDYRQLEQAAGEADRIERAGGPEGATSSSTRPADLFNDPLLEEVRFWTSLPEVPTETVDRESFEPPASLDELIAAHEWTEIPVVDGYAELAEQKPTTAEVDLAAATGMANDSAEANETLVRAFGALPASDDEVDYEAEIRFAWGADAKTANPILGSSVYDFELAGFTGIGLWGLSQNLDTYPSADTVESYRRSDDALVDLFVLRDDLFWSDGEPVTAGDIAFTFRTILNPEVPAVAVRSGTDELVDVVAYDDRTVAFFHESTKATNAANTNFSIIPKHIFAESMKADPTLKNSAEHVAYEKDPVVAGPYRIRSRVIGQEIVLERRPEYFEVDGQAVRKKPHFKTIRIRIIEDQNTRLLALKKGDVDYLEPLTPDQWDGQTDSDEFYARNTKLSGEEWVYFYFGWNNESPFFRDRRVRLAMSLAFDHDEFQRTIGKGLFRPGIGTTPEAAWWAPQTMPEPLSQDLDAAEKLLAEAGWEDTNDDGTLDKDGREFVFTMPYSSGAKVSEAAVGLLRSNLAQIGIRLNPKPTEFTVLQQRARDHEFDAMFAGWGTGADPDSGKNIWTTRAIETGGRNYVNFRNEAVDRLYELGIYELDRERRGRLYGRIAEIIWAEQPYTFIYYRSTFVGMSNRLRGITFSPRGPLGFSGGFEGLWKPKQAPDQSPEQLAKQSTQR